MGWPAIIALGFVGLLLLAILALVHYRFWVRRYRVELEYAERHELRADDGLPFTLLRLAAAPADALRGRRS